MNSYMRPNSRQTLWRRSVGALSAGQATLGPSQRWWRLVGAGCGSLVRLYILGKNTIFKFQPEAPEVFPLAIHLSTKVIFIYLHKDLVVHRAPPSWHCLQVPPIPLGDLLRSQCRDMGQWFKYDGDVEEENHHMFDISGALLVTGVQTSNNKDVRKHRKDHTESAI